MFHQRRTLTDLFLRPNRRYYEQLGVELGNSTLTETNVGDAKRVADLLACDAIHLTGGNTYRFLRWLQATDLLGALRKYTLGGGVLVGTSAGSLLMTRDISIAQLSPDDASLGPTSRKAAGPCRLFSFGRTTKRPELDLKSMTYLSGIIPRLACPDGSGHRSPWLIDMIGDVKVFRYGRSTPDLLLRGA